MVSIRRSEVPQAREAAASSLRRPWEATGAVDVETLVRWAYDVQMVDRFERFGLSTIEAAVSGFEPNGYSTCGVGQLMKIQHLGCRIDQAGAQISDAVHPVAYAVASALRRLEHGQRVRAHALAGTRPTAWVAPDRKARATVWVKPWREAQVEYQGPGRKGGYCQVILSWDARREAWGRDEYRLWWQALADLAWQLSLASLGFAVTGPVAAAEPWQAAPGGPPASTGGPTLPAAPGGAHSAAAAGAGQGVGVRRGGAAGGADAAGEATPPPLGSSRQARG